MKTIKGPGIFLAQFADNQAPFNTLEGMAHWAAQLGFVGVQIPSWDRRLFDLKLAAESRDYCEEILGILDGAGLKLTELSTHLQGQLVASQSCLRCAARRLRSVEAGWQAQGAAGVGGAATWSGQQRQATGLGLLRMQRSPARWHGRTFIPGRRGPRD